MMELPARLGRVCGIFGRYSYICVTIYTSTHIFEEIICLMKTEVQKSKETEMPLIK